MNEYEVDTEGNGNELSTQLFFTPTAPIQQLRRVISRSSHRVFFIFGLYNDAVIHKVHGGLMVNSDVKTNSESLLHLHLRVSRPIFMYMAPSFYSAYFCVDGFSIPANCTYILRPASTFFFVVVEIIKFNARNIYPGIVNINRK